ncbi:hypothetical protein LARV_02832 [Longilinea arvoryzae]|uniref:Prenyltransferase-like n=1 Tax=Longilinea arvoryzae TaxID=360412 RepID=A0A0S7BBB0_9CHLR|nr:hypothetical protein [Longilinea arvoryzae]GAP15052.1 hypothetical protein LARV_02832 [Longilinea arvoryzae]
MLSAEKEPIYASDPVLKFTWVVKVRGASPQSDQVRQARQEIPTSPRVQAMLAGRDEQGRLPFHPYQKWLGAHWVLALLAEWGYPAGDDTLFPLREQELAWLLSPTHQKNIRHIAGLTRRCASQEGNALYALLTLGLADERCDELAHRLVAWQWPDGGWNCDKHPRASHSSFHESLIPLRALALHARLTGNADSQNSAERAAEIFLSRRLFRRLKDGSVIDPHFLELHYPFYWHYDVLFGLLVMAECGWIHDPRCKEALDWLESRRLPDGNFPADARWYTVTQREVSGRSATDWGVTSAKVHNPFVSVLAHFVLKASGRG